MCPLSKKRKESADANKQPAPIGPKSIGDNSHLGGSWFPPATSDLVFVCNGHDFKVHKAVVVRHSAVIRAAVEGNFLEARTNTIRMDGFQPPTVRSLVDFMYGQDYPWSASRRKPRLDFESGGASLPASARASTAMPRLAPATERIMEHVGVNSIADYYAMPALVKLANDKIRDIVLPPPGAERDRSWVPNIVPMVQAALQMTGDEQLLEVLAVGFSLDPGTLADPGRLRHLEVVPAFCTHVIQACIFTINGSAVDLAKANGDLADLRKQYIHGMSTKGLMMRDQDVAINRHRTAFSMLNRTDACAGCSTQFPCTVHPDELSLHCLHCGHEHALAEGS